jgi:hypothetical protein
MSTAKVTPYKAICGVLGLLDVLNAKRMSSARLEALYVLLSDSSVTVGAGLDASAKLHKNRSANAFLLGDGLIVAQNSGEPGSWSSVIRGIVAASSLLFEQDFAHRAVILKGDYICAPGRKGPAVIFGAAVIRAVELERKIKVVGISIDDSMKSNWPRMTLDLGIHGRPLWSCTFSETRFLTSVAHIENWKRFCIRHCTDHAYSAAGMVLATNKSYWKEKYDPGW